MKSGTETRFAVNLDRAADAFYDSMDHGQSHAGPFSLCFGGEKWIEDAIHDIRRYAVSGVAHAQSHIASGLEAHRFCPEIRIDFHVRKAQLQHAAMAQHGVGGIGAQVHHDLMDLRRVGQGIGITSDIGFDFNRRRQGSP